MASINGRQQVGHGVGGGNASVDNVAFSSGAWGGFIDDDHAFFANGADNWVAAIYNLATGAITRAAPPESPFYGWGWNTGYAGGGTWAGWLAGGAGLYTSYGLHLPDAGLLGMGLHGELGYKPLYQSYGPTVCRERDGSEWTLTPGHAYDLQLLGNHQAIWQESSAFRVAGLPQPQQLGSATRPNAYLINGRWWVSYWSSVAGIVLHPFDELNGIVIVPPGVDAWQSSRVFGSVVEFALSNSEGEQAGQLRKEFVDVTAVPLVPLAPSTTIPTFTFTHPVLVAPFKDPSGDTTAPMEIVVNQTGQERDRPCFVAEDSLAWNGVLEGIYSEASNPVSALALAMEYETRLVLAHDATADWYLPGGLRAYDLPTLELYLSQTETLDTSVARWHSQVQRLLDDWPGSIGVTPMFYCMGGAPPDELFTVSQVLAGLAHLSDIVNHSPRVIVIAPFAYQRANGITGHAELQQAFANLLTEQRRVGLATLPPVTTEPQPPEPTPPEPTPIPKPYRTHTKGLHMDIDGKTVILRGPAGNLMRPDAPNTGTWADLKNPDGSPANWRGVLFDTLNASDAATHHRATKLSNGRYSFTHVDNNGLAGADATKYSGSIPAQLYYKTDGNTDVGSYEEWRVYDGNENGAIEAQIEYSNTEGKYFAYPLAVEVVG